MIQTVFGLVKVLEKKDITGAQKKDELYKTLKELLGEQKFNENKEIVDYILETIIFISKTHTILGINENSFSYCCKK